MSDPVVDQLSALFRDDPRWQSAASRVSDASQSDVYFSHLPGRAWHLAREQGSTVLQAGRAADPDFVFRFSPAAVERLARVDGGITDVALELFSLMESEDPDARVDFRVAAPFARLVRRGYLALLLGGGPALLAFGARHGVRSVAALKRVVVRSLRSPPFDFEVRE